MGGIRSKGPELIEQTSRATGALGRLNDDAQGSLARSTTSGVDRYLLGQQLVLPFFCGEAMRMLKDLWQDPLPRGENGGVVAVTLCCWGKG